MFKPLSRSNKNSHRSNGGFADTMFVHADGDDDYSGFAPTQMFEEEDDAAPMPVQANPHAARAAASTSHTALERAASMSAPAAAQATATEDASIPQSWVTSQWVAAQEAKAHEAANQARAVIAAQRRADEQAEAAQHHAAMPAAPRTGLARLRAALGRLLPGEFRSLLPLFIGVTVTVALISAVLPLLDKP
ncbi:hypothetical protein [Scleromatobacter humisilvae]|uniref:Uncharacterized protein n=1 Tax=Scleromatobacter humisilvae TaxID=2897159 RepID=A0A9X2BYC3_9BURK|nr:hypothetical protein [Scleromatobacter humisilvae]MCK9685473.1 hypothetical protein [Scleromatobacter humisilvae]